MSTGKLLRDVQRGQAGARRSAGGALGTRAFHVGVAAILAATLVALPANAGTTLGAGVTFDGQPTAAAVLLQPIVFRQSFSAAQAPQRVELLWTTPFVEGTFEQLAQVARAPGGGYVAVSTITDHETPNTIFDYRFRVTAADGSVTLGPQAQATVVDNRFHWQTITGTVLRLHWYQGSQSFARQALSLGEGAIEKAAKLLGVQNIKPVDFFIYANTQAFFDALGPGTPENVGGEYIDETHTMFADIAPSDIGTDWVKTVIPHELTHLVFALATDNPYHQPPRWLNEGLAVYLSEGGPGPRHADLEQGIQSNTIIPLTALTAAFPSSNTAGLLAYAESVSAVNYLIQTYGQATLVTLIRSYKQGVSDDQAFQSAIGRSMAQFDAAWLRSIGARTPVVYGPRPAPPGPEPSAWSAGPTASGTPTSSGAPASPVPAASGQAAALPPGGSPTPASAPLAAAGNAPVPPVVLVLVALVLVLLGAGGVLLRVGLRGLDLPEDGADTPRQDPGGFGG